MAGNQSSTFWIEAFFCRESQSTVTTVRMTMNVAVNVIGVKDGGVNMVKKFSFEFLFTDNKVFVVRIGC